MSDRAADKRLADLLAWAVVPDPDAGATTAATPDLSHADVIVLSRLPAPVAARVRAWLVCASRDGLGRVAPLVSRDVGVGRRALEAVCREVGWP